MRGFSWKRAIGISSLKSKIARTTGIPTTKSGRARKWGFWPILARATATGKGDGQSSGGGCGGCLVLLLVMGGCGYALTFVPTPKPRARPVSIPVATPEPPQENVTPLPAPILSAPHEDEPARPAAADSEPAPAAPLSYKQAQPEAYGQSQVNLARQYLKLKRTDKAREILTAVVNDLPGTEAAEMAQQELDKLLGR